MFHVGVIRPQRNELAAKVTCNKSRHTSLVHKGGDAHLIEGPATMPTFRGGPGAGDKLPQLPTGLVDRWMGGRWLKA